MKFIQFCDTIEFMKLSQTLVALCFVLSLGGCSTFSAPTAANSVDINVNRGQVSVGVDVNLMKQHRPGGAAGGISGSVSGSARGGQLSISTNRFCMRHPYHNKDGILIGYVISCH